MDERGDVGSWVRIASVQAIGRTVQLLLTSTVPKSAWLPQDMYHAIWCGLLKQGAERLDNVRVEVGKQMRRLLDVVYGEWEPKGGNIMRNLFAIEYVRSHDHLSIADDPVEWRSATVGTNRTGSSPRCYSFFKYQTTGTRLLGESC